MILFIVPTTGGDCCFVVVVVVIVVVVDEMGLCSQLQYLRYQHLLPQDSSTNTIISHHVTIPSCDNDRR